MNIVPYLFLDSEQLRFGKYPVLDTILYRWARKIEETLFEEARVEVYAGASVVEEMRFSAFFTSLRRPRPIYFFTLEPFQGTGLFLVDNRFSTFCLKKRGSADAGEIKLTPDNQGRLQKIVERLMADFSDSWSDIHEVNPRLQKVTTYPFRARVLHPHEMCLVVQIHLSGHNISSRLTWCFPRPMLEPVLQKLQYSKVIPPLRRRHQPEVRMDSGQMMKHLRYGMQLRMGRVDLPHGEASLKVGSVVPLEIEFENQAVVDVEGQPALVASVGEVDGHYAFKVAGPYQPPGEKEPIEPEAFQPMQWQQWPPGE